ncbi:MAG TPA: tetratricopeptide repeat protein, partial [Vicinamibacterales bacterium]
DCQEAERCYSQSLELFRRIDDKAGQASCMADLGYLVCRKGDRLLAASLYQESLVLFGELGDRRGIVRGLEGFALLAATGNRPEASLQLAAATEMLRENLRMPGALSPQREMMKRVIDGHREQMGNEAHRLWTTGRAMTIEQAIEFALDCAAQ